MSRTKGRFSGWAAFDLKQQQKQGVEPGTDSEPFPPMGSSRTSRHSRENFGRNDDLSFRSFSSVITPSVDLSTLSKKKEYKKATQVIGTSGKVGDNVVEENVNRLSLKKLKELHCWAQYSLIEDIMVAVNNDVDKASTLLKAMVSTGSLDGNNKTHSVSLVPISEDLLCDSNTLKADKSVSLVKPTDPAVMSSTLKDRLIDQNKDITIGSTSYENKHSDDAADMEWILRHLNSLPVEPEYEEDDIYLTYRKDAIKAMRSASQHSRAATNAYLTGDHLSAQQHSLKAREEWIAAERLNAKAAKEILSIRNRENNMWRLDLHGLHASEATQTLKEHLYKIETNIPRRSGFHNGDMDKNGVVRSRSLETLSDMDLQKLNGCQASSGQKPVSLVVITGRGNHSRSQPALPAAVRSFLNENGYRFDESRPGVVTVRPKFRYAQFNSTAE